MDITTVNERLARYDTISAQNKFPATVPITPSLHIHYYKHRPIRRELVFAAKLALDVRTEAWWNALIVTAIKRGLPTAPANNGASQQTELLRYKMIVARQRYDRLRSWYNAYATLDNRIG